MKKVIKKAKVNETRCFVAEYKDDHYTKGDYGLIIRDIRTNGYRFCNVSNNSLSNDTWGTKNELVTELEHWDWYSFKSIAAAIAWLSKQMGE